MKNDQAREGYRAALQMIGYQSKVVWDTFHSLLAANAILVGLSGAALKLYPQFTWLPRVLALLGLGVCVAWFLMTMRNFDYYRYYFAWARKYEGIAFGSDGHIIQRGKKFGDGESVDEIDEPKRMRWGSRLFNIQWLSYIVIAGFAVVYYCLLTGST